MTRWVVFDCGNVPSAPHTGLDAQARVPGAPEDRFEEVYWSFRLGYDNGCPTRSTGGRSGRRWTSEFARLGVLWAGVL
ncbi:hypothetical protein ACQPW3_41025 [Actinosynnema sp. CA-248983]